MAMVRYTYKFEFGALTACLYKLIGDGTLKATCGEFQGEKFGDTWDGFLIGPELLSKNGRIRGQSQLSQSTFFEPLENSGLCLEQCIITPSRSNGLRDVWQF
jgi:hypothetical protein